MSEMITGRQSNEIERGTNHLDVQAPAKQVHLRGNLRDGLLEFCLGDGHKIVVVQRTACEDACARCVDLALQGAHHTIDVAQRKSGILRVVPCLWGEVVEVPHSVGDNERCLLMLRVLESACNRICMGRQLCHMRANVFSHDAKRW